MQEILTVNNLSKTFKLSKKQQKSKNINQAYIKAVDNISFTAYKGEVFGFVGPNGAGKTTTMRMLATLINPDSGDASVGGYSIKNEPRSVRGNIGFLTNELKLDEYFTPSYHFDFFCEMYGIDKNTAKERKELLFKKFGIDKFAHVKTANLSQGMKQKTSLAVSIAHDPPIIIFDEPTNGLDIITAKVVTDFLSELKRNGKSIILSTHIFSLIENLCDRVGIIIDGKMVACAPASEIAGDKTFEERFFEIYNETTGDAV